MKTNSELRKLILNEYHYVDSHSHERDNGFMFDTNIEIWELELNKKGYTIIGYTEAPKPSTFSKEYNKAIVLENLDNFEKTWCHISDLIYESIKNGEI